MNVRPVAAALVAAGLVAGATLPDVGAPPTRRGSWIVIEADFHVHSFTADGAQSPLGLMLQARRHGLHAFAMTNHSRLFASRFGRWLSHAVGGPTIVLGEEITAPDYHLVGLGLSRRVRWRQPAAAAIDSIHAQGGLAIAAHPTERSWRDRAPATLARLDGAEVMQSVGLESRRAGMELRDFRRALLAARPGAAAVASSDHHWLDDLGVCRTYVFVRANTEREILEAVRAGRTVARDVDGRLVGEPALVAVLETQPLGAPGVSSDYGYHAASSVRAVARAAGWIGLVGLLLCAPTPRRSRPRGVSGTASSTDYTDSNSDEGEG